MKKKWLKILISILILLMIFVNNVYASTLINLYGKDQESNLSTDTTNTINTALNRAIYISKVIAVGIAIIMLILLGIKYVVASPGDKAEVKKHLTVYVVGAVVAFGSYALLEIVQNFAIELK